MFYIKYKFFLSDDRIRYHNHIFSSFSVTLMVRYALKFDHPIPLSIAKLKQISALTDIHYEGMTSDRKTSPLMDLIIKNSTKGNITQIV